MGRIKRQGLGVSLFLYGGLILGFINTGFLFPRILPEEVLGFTQFVAKASGILTLISLLGLPIFAIRFFPTVRNSETRHQGFLTSLLLVGMIMTAMSTTFLLVFDQAIVSFFQSDNKANDLSNKLIQDFFWGLVAWFVINNFLVLLTAYANALKRPRVPAFLSEIIGRLATLILLLLFYFKLIDQNWFVALYSVKQAILVIGVICFLVVIQEFHLQFSKAIFKRPDIWEWARYSVYTSFNQIGDRLETSIDTLMITKVLGLGQTGVYVLFQYLSTVIIMSHRGMRSIANAMVAEYWEKNQIDKIENLYKRLALSNLVVALLVYVGILVNLDNAIAFYGTQYQEGRMVAVFLGAAQIIHVINGYNGMILMFSPKYKYSLYFKLVTVLLTITTNYFLIGWYGITGAASATAVTILVSNILNQWFVIRTYSIHPFSTRMIRAILVAGVVYTGISIIPILHEFVLVDAILRSIITVLVYGILTYLLGVSPDINQYVNDLWSKISKAKT